WDEAEAFLREQEYSHAAGRPQRIFAAAIDSGGHHADAVYAFAHKLRALRVHAIKGASSAERAIDNGNTRVGYKWNGRTEKAGPVLWHVGTNLAKDRFQSRLELPTPGPGYVHLSDQLSLEWFKQLAGEIRATRRMRGGTETRWTPSRKRIEVKDCLTYAIWLEERLDLWSPRRAKWWDQLEAQVQPDDDLFTPPRTASVASESASASVLPPAITRRDDSRGTSAVSKPGRGNGFATRDGWGL
ncbi:MAG TPA: terminase gpA endonuclease subunit, partial [Rhizomicrobium sp.]|nr:terminase gpA endonuclease subunit [Rhizomicrobium sp.]